MAYVKFMVQGEMEVVEKRVRHGLLVHTLGKGIWLREKVGCAANVSQMQLMSPSLESSRLHWRGLGATSGQTRGFYHGIFC